MIVSDLTIQYIKKEKRRLKIIKPNYHLQLKRFLLTHSEILLKYAATFNYSTGALIYFAPGGNAR